MDSIAAPTRSSFAFLAPHGPLYLRLATVAEHALALDPSLTLVSLRQLAEAFAKHAAAKAGLLASGAASQLDLLRVLEQRNIVRDRIAECFHMLRRVGNAAVHEARVAAIEATALAKGFRGELVEQDPDDEPADVLLKRIRATRAEEPAKTGRGRNGGRTAKASVEAVPAKNPARPRTRVQREGSR